MPGKPSISSRHLAADAYMRGAPDQEPAPFSPSMELPSMTTELTEREKRESGPNPESERALQFLAQAQGLHMQTHGYLAKQPPIAFGRQVICLAVALKSHV